MYSTPRKRRAFSNHGSPAKKVPLKGLFVDGVWHCNCQPRLPAAHFLVRKEGPNKGRWFYTCQEPKEEGCGFFLWDDDAKGREMSAVINNSRSEPAAVGEDTPTATARDRNSTAIPDKTLVEGHIAASNKWMADLNKKDEEEFGDWPLSLDDELEVADTVDKAFKLPDVNPETPRKALKFDAMTTPGSKRKREDIWPTPQTSHRDDVFMSPPSTRLKGSMWDGNEKPGLISPSATPTPDRFRDVIKDARASEDRGTDYDITQEVMELLKDHSLDEDTSTRVREVLNKHALKSLGIARGRDMTRLALKTKDAKIAELQQRITALETERDMDKVVIRHFKSDMANSIGNKRGRGRGRGS